MISIVSKTSLAQLALETTKNPARPTFPTMQLYGWHRQYTYLPEHNSTTLHPWSFWQALLDLSYANVGNISSQQGDRLSRGDTLVTPTQCAGKYIMYTHSWAICYATQASGNSRTFSLEGTSGGHGFWSGGIQLKQLQVSYYEPYYASPWF